MTSESMGSPARLVVLISGNGSNLQAVLDACTAGQLAARVVAVFSNQAEAYGLQRATQAGVPAFCFLKSRGTDRCTYDAQLGERVAAFAPDWVLLLGWMRLLGSGFLDRFPGRVINIHPALPGTFPGTHAIERAFEAYQRGEVRQTGVMIHKVLDEGVDCGPVLSQAVVPIFPEDNLQSLEARIHQTEHHLMIKVLEEIIPFQGR
jgi:formyltetrahydrofolate-dependent phosphoribosylglycinamide formyltransferase